MLEFQHFVTRIISLYSSINHFHDLRFETPINYTSIHHKACSKKHSHQFFAINYLLLKVTGTCYKTFVSVTSVNHQWHNTSWSLVKHEQTQEEEPQKHNHTHRGISHNFLVQKPLWSLTVNFFCFFGRFFSGFVIILIIAEELVSPAIDVFHLWRLIILSECCCFFSKFLQDTEHCVKRSLTQMEQQDLIGSFMWESCPKKHCAHVFVLGYEHNLNQNNGA